ncbi:MAG: DUF2085 domain-containing protein [Anaerolineales bacterium]|nr:DUF2085 domain-containing protein [Anaerolineales bacterium]
MANTTPPADRPRAMGRARDFVVAADRAILALSRHWLLYLNLLVFAYVGLPFLAPVFMEAGLPAPARVIYTMYGGLCHQLGYRSWYLFGERAAYPRDIFQAYTGIDPQDPSLAGLNAARAFIGNERTGWKVAYCERDVAIYAAILAGGLLYALPGVRRRVRPLNWLAYGLIGIVPVALDGFSQLFSQYPYNALDLFGVAPFGWLAYRESTPLLRALTGALFGLANVWLAYPYLAQSMADIRNDLEAKFTRAGLAI